MKDRGTRQGPAVLGSFYVAGAAAVVVAQSRAPYPIPSLGTSISQGGGLKKKKKKKRKKKQKKVMSKLGRSIT